MNRKAFTLIEVLIGMMLIVVITATFFPSISNGVKMLFDAKKITEHAFEGQTQIEQGILALNVGDTNGWNDNKVTLFKQTVPLSVYEFSLPGSRSIQLALSKERDFSPELPEIKSVTLNSTDNSVFTGQVEYANKKNGKNWEPDVEFCIYRWYLGDLSYLSSDFNKDSRTKLSLLKEYNPVREDGNGPLFDKAQHLIYENSDNELQIGDKTYSIIAGDKNAPILSIIPNTKSSVTNERTVDQFWKYSLNLKKNDEMNNFTDEEMKEFYANQGVVFSATPVAKETGLVGEEKFSQMLSLKYENSSVLDNWKLGIVPIPENVGATHLVEGVVSFSSKGIGVENKKFHVSFLKTSTSEIVDEQDIVTNKDGYAFFVQTLNTDDSYVIRVERSEDDKKLEGHIDFKNYDFYFVDPNSSFDEGVVAEITARLTDKTDSGVKNALVQYQVLNPTGKIIHKSSIYTDKGGNALLRIGRQKGGEYVIKATAITPSGQKLTIEHKFVVQKIN